MGKVKRIYVEKKASFAVKAKELEEELKSSYGAASLLYRRVIVCVQCLWDSKVAHVPVPAFSCSSQT